ncbi:hypothetical protein [Paraburkholderia sp. USG1]|nr:hypothetical protein [Paraburkholderia sp. USG1]
MRGDFEVCEIDGSPATHAARAALQHRVTCGAPEALPCGVRPQAVVGLGMKNAFVVVIYDDLSERRRHEGNRTDPVV